MEADGEYKAPAELFLLGQPDMPVKSIKVETRETELAGKKYLFRDATWDLPYKRVYWRSQRFVCKDINKLVTDEQHRQGRSVIVNGVRKKELYDCKHGIVGEFLDESFNEPVISLVQDHYMEYHYPALCLKVTGEAPYKPH